ncbi:hypothetical protein [Halovenus marina]|uniref:hypothetical protein n=1 Tax=Halovenus marina TaxID=3396621 RepID=UPI003F568BDB
MKRRRFLAGAGIALSVISAGCLSSGSTDPNDDGNTTDGTDDQSNSADGSADDGSGDGTDEKTPPQGDDDDRSIDGRVHNRTDTTRTVSVTIFDGETKRSADDVTVGPGTSEALPAVGTPGMSLTFEVNVDGTTARKTIDFDVENTPERTDGYVDIAYTAAETIEIIFTPIEELTGNDVDTPPYEIEEPPCNGPEDEQPVWLCENMSAEPSLDFEQAETGSSVLQYGGLRHMPQSTNTQVYVTVLTDADDIDRVYPDWGNDAIALIESTEFESEAVLLIETAWGSGSVTPHLKRIETTDEGIHAFGCYRRPCVRTDDYTTRTAVARFEQPETLDSTAVSLTVSADSQVTIDATETVVTATDL